MGELRIEEVLDEHVAGACAWGLGMSKRLTLDLVEALDGAKDGQCIYVWRRVGREWRMSPDYVRLCGELREAFQRDGLHRQAPHE